MFFSKMAQISCLPFCHDFAADNNNAENDQKLTALHFFGAPIASHQSLPLQHK